MKKQFLFTILFFCLFSLSNCSDNASINKKELEKALSKFNKAFAAGDNATLETMIPENYRHSNGNSKAIDKKTWFGYLEKRKKEISNGNTEVLTYSMDEIDIQMHQNSAIVTGRVLVKTQKKDTILENSYRVTHLWVYEKNQWKRAGFHDGKIQ